MKKNKTEESVNLILKDEEIGTHIEELVEIAKTKGYKSTHLTLAIAKKWNEKYPISKEDYQFSEKEGKFSEQAKRFLKFYKDQLIELYIKEKGEVVDEKNFLDEMHKLICSTYMVLNKEDRVTKQLIEKYLVMTFNQRNINVKGYLELLYIFFYKYLCFFDDENKKPKVVEGYFHYFQSIMGQRSFRFFNDRHYTKVNSQKAAVAVTWMIEKYF